MPITRKQFELGINSRIEGWMKRIHAFLAERKDEAFSTPELKEQLHPYPSGKVDLARKREYAEYIRNYGEDNRAIELAIEKLVQLRAIEEREISGAGYYLYRGPLVLDDDSQNVPF